MHCLRSRDVTGRMTYPLQKILVVDDCRPMREAVAEQLERRGYIVRTVSNGRDALEECELFRPSAVILDIFMPGMDGFATMYRLQQLPYRPRVIAISGEFDPADSEFRSIASKLGAHSTLGKPFTTAELLASVREVTLEH